MVEPIYSRPGLVVADSDRFRVLGAPSGPAGVSSVDLPDGSMWEVDHADPATLVELDVDATDPARSPLLADAFGGDNTLFMLDQALRVGTDETDWAFIDSRRPDPPRLASRPHPVRRDVARDVGRLVLLADLVLDRNLHPLARVTAALETAASALPRSRMHIGVVVPGLLHRAAQLTADVDDPEIELVDAAVLAHVRLLCLEATKTIRTSTEAASALEQLAARASRAVHSRGTVTDRPVEVDRAAIEEEPSEDLLDAAPSRIAAMRIPAPEEPVLERTADSVIQVSVTRSDERRWVRVLHEGSFILLGQAALMRRDLMDTAEVVVPADALDENLHVQVIDESNLHRSTRAPLDAIRAAVSAGREAARADRLGNTTQARSRWQHCALLWEEAGDSDRSSRARELSRVAATRWVQPTPTADRIAETLAPHM